MTAKVLYVTSFSPDLFHATGRNLIESWLAAGKPGRLLVCSEGLPNLNRLYPKLAVKPIDKHPLLLEWFEKNKHIVPDYLGGTALECRCEGREKRHAKHKQGCHWQWMNRNAFRFLRKVAAWQAAMDFGYDTMVWLDSDCRFVRGIPEARLEVMFGESSVFYFRAHRPVVETGVVGFHLQRQGKAFIDAVADRFLSGEFRKYERWDDGYIFTTVVDEKRFPTRDCAPAMTLRPGSGKLDNHIMKHSEVWKYIQHHKGTHGTGLGVMA